MGVSTEEPQIIDNDGFSDDDTPEEAHKSILKAVSQLYKKQRIEAPKRKEAAQVISEFNLSKNTEDGGTKVHVNELLKDLKQKVTHKEINKKVLDAQKKSRTLPTPLEKHTAEKIHRKIGYENVKKKLDKWNTIVERNRLASQLTFPLQQKEPQKEPVNFLKTFERPSELEQAMAAVLNQSETAKEERQLENDLSQLSIEEMIERRRMMAKMRARESYRIAKAARQNKIKSKKYRRILKKERIKQELLNFEKLQKTDPEAALEKLEQIERARAEERISLRHRNTGKWAKSQAIRAKYDTEARKQLAEQLAKSRDLTRKIRNNESSDEQEVSEEESDGEPNEELTQTYPSTPDKKLSNPWFNNEYENFLKGCNEFLEKTSDDKELVTEVPSEVITQAVSESHEEANNKTNQINVSNTQNSDTCETTKLHDSSESIVKLSNEDLIVGETAIRSPLKEKATSQENILNPEVENEIMPSESPRNNDTEGIFNENVSPKEKNIRKSVSKDNLVTHSIENASEVTKRDALTPKKSEKFNTSPEIKSPLQNVSPRSTPVVQLKEDTNIKSIQIDKSSSQEDAWMLSVAKETDKNLSPGKNIVRKSLSKENLATKTSPHTEESVTLTHIKSPKLNSPLKEKSKGQNIEEEVCMLQHADEISNGLSDANLSQAKNIPKKSVSRENLFACRSKATPLLLNSSLKEKDTRHNTSPKSKVIVNLDDNNTNSIQVLEDSSEDDVHILSDTEEKSPPRIAKKRQKTLITNSGAWDVVVDGPAKKKKIVDPDKKKRKNDSEISKNKKKEKLQNNKKLKEKSIADLFDDAQETIQNHTIKAVSQIKSDLESNKKSNISNPSENIDDSKKQDQKNKSRGRGIDEALVEIHEEGISSGTNDLKVLKDKLSGVEQASVKEPQIDPNKHINVKPQKLFSEIGDIEEKEDDDSDNDEDTQRLHLIEAFADDDIAEEFRKEKNDEAKKNKAEDINLSMPGWGSWGGTSIKPRTKRKNRRFMVRLPKIPRKDADRPTVIINEDPVPKLKEQLVNELPYPFTSVKDFEATIRAPLGKHWIPEKAHKKLTAPPVRTRMGTIITPMSDEVATSKPKRKKRVNTD